jgi:hypothetical protein
MTDQTQTTGVDQRKYANCSGIAMKVSEVIDPFQDAVRHMHPDALREALNRSLARVYTHTQDRSIGIISGNRRNVTREENIKARQELMRDIRRAGFGYANVRGVGPENGAIVSEPAILVIGHKGDDPALKAFLISQGRRLNQNSVLYKSGSSNNATGIYTKDDPINQRSDGQEEDWGPWHANRSAAQYLTRLKGDRHFDFAHVPANQGDPDSKRLLSHQTRQDEMMVAYTQPTSFSNRHESLF